MPNRIFLLGPDHWDDDHEPSPKRLRQRLANAVWEESGGRTEAFVMDASLGPAGLEDDDLFDHIRKTKLVDAYFFVLPPGCKQHGTTWEEGFLNAENRRSKLDIHAFPHVDYLREDENGKFQLQSGHRTSYNRALLRIAANVQQWRREPELFDLVVEAATQDLPEGKSSRAR